MDEAAAQRARAARYRSLYTVIAIAVSSGLAFIALLAAVGVGSPGVLPFGSWALLVGAGMLLTSAAVVAALFTLRGMMELFGRDRAMLMEAARSATAESEQKLGALLHTAEDRIGARQEEAESGIARIRDDMTARFSVLAGLPERVAALSDQRDQDVARLEEQNAATLRSAQVKVGEAGRIFEERLSEVRDRGREDARRIEAALEAGDEDLHHHVAAVEAALHEAERRIEAQREGDVARIDAERVRDRVELGTAFAASVEDAERRRLESEEALRDEVERAAEAVEAERHDRARAEQEAQRVQHDLTARVERHDAALERVGLHEGTVDARVRHAEDAIHAIEANQEAHDETLAGLEASAEHNAVRLGAERERRQAADRAIGHRMEQVARALRTDRRVQHGFDAGLSNLRRDLAEAVEGLRHEIGDTAVGYVERRLRELLARQEAALAAYTSELETEFGDFVHAGSENETEARDEMGPHFAVRSASPFGLVYPIRELPALTDDDRAALRAEQVRDTRALWAASTRRIARATGHTEAVVRRWQAACELMAIDGIGPQTARVLAEAGIDSVHALATLRVRDLLDAVAAYDRRRGALRHKRIDAHVATGWIAAANAHRPTDAPSVPRAEQEARAKEAHAVPPAAER